MFSKTIFVSILIALSNAAAVPGLSKRGDGVLSLDFSVHRPSTNETSNNSTVISPPARANSKRDTGEYPVELQGLKTLYLAELFLGSNNQAVHVDIDTGSSDLWVIDSSAGVSTQWGTYDHTTSTTYSDTGEAFSIGYLDRSSASGTYVKDSVSLSSSGPTIKGQKFGDGTSVSSFTYGILGVAQVGDEADHENYDNVPVSLKKQGIIDKTAYSIYLDSKDADSGTVLFGGIDTAKYTGDLVQLPIQSTAYFQIQADSFDLNGKSVDAPAVILDTGSTIGALTADVLSQVASLVGAGNFNDGSPYGGNTFYYWDDESQVPDGFSIKFGDVSITIPKEDLVITLGTIYGQAVPALGFTQQSINILGDNFLRHAYTVYNIDESWIKVGNVKYTTDTNVQAL